MSKAQQEQLTLTEALAASQLREVRAGVVMSASSGQNEPYSELYQRSTAIIETPVQRLQRAAREDRR